MWWTLGAALAGNPLVLPDVDDPLRTGRTAKGESAVVVGIETYAFGLPPVPFAQRDADAFYTFLTYTRGIPKENVHVPGGGSREMILEAVTQAAKEAGNGGTVWFYYAGHGAASPATGERMLLGDDVRASTAVFESRSVKVEEIEAAIIAVGARPVLVLDTCYAGQSRAGKTLFEGGRFAVPATAVVVPKNAARWTAAAADQISGPLEATSHGAFTYFALGALRGWADGELDGKRDGKVTATEADAYVGRALKTLQKRAQTPSFVGQGDLVLAEGVAEVGPSFNQDSAIVTVAPPVQETWSTAERKLANGLRALISYDPENPQFTATVVVKTGRAEEPDGLGGIHQAAFSASILQDELVDRAAALGATVSVAVTSELGKISVRGPIGQAEPMLAILADALADPDFEVGGARLQSDYRYQQLDPKTRGEIEIERMFYADHPRGRPYTDTTRRAATTEALRRYWDDHVRPDAALLVVAGGVDADTLARAAGPLLAWRGTAKPVSPAVMPKPPKPEVVVIHEPGAALVSVIATAALTAADEAESVRLELGNEAFGNGFTSRLNLVLREDKGWTYAARSALRPTVEGRLMWSLGTSVRADVVADTLDEVDRQIARLRTDPLTPAEVDPLRDGLVRLLTADVRKASAVSDVEAARFVYGRSATVSARANGLARVTAAEASDALARRLSADQIVWVLVGDKEKILAEMKGTSRKIRVLE